MKYKGNEKEYMRQWHLKTWPQRAEKRKKQVKALLARKRLQLIEYKKTQSCSKCGNNDHRVLQFHHVGGKEFAIADALKRGLSLERVMKEITKCKVLCANCHAIEHYQFSG